uniref:DNA-directed DNA polymerase n=1 Tax=viral metagenome TaxID=1070528 RepID=A0A6C0E8J6_9ZZZZ
MTVYLGAHTSIANGFLNGLKYIESIGGNVSQVFLGNKLSAQLKFKTKLSDQTITEIRQYLKQNDHMLFVHAAYVLNLCSKPPTSQAIQYQLDNLKYDLELGYKIGFSGLVVHIGSKLMLDRDIAYKNMAECIIEVINRSAGDGRIILETPAGQGTQIATSLEDLVKLWQLFPNKFHNRLGICVDTCHIFSSGEPIHTPDGVLDYFKKFDQLIGLKHLYLVHLNDSKKPLNSRKDRHENLTEGYIYNNYFGGNIESLKILMQYLAKHKIPALLETPGDGSINDSDAGSYQSQFIFIQSLVPIYKKLPKPSIYLHTQYLNKNKYKSTHKHHSHLKTLNKTFNKTSNKISNKMKNQSGGMSIWSSREPNNKIIKILNELSYQYQIRKEIFRSRAFGNAALILTEFNEKIISTDQIKDLPRIGRGIIEKIDEILKTGHLKILDELKNEHVPQDNKTSEIQHIEELTSILGIGPQLAKKFIKNNIKTIKDLEKKVKDGEITLNHQQMIGLKYHTDLNKLIPREDAHKIVLNIKKMIKRNKTWANLEIIHAGSYPSGKKASKDIDVLIFDPRIKTRKDLETSNLLPEILNHLVEKKLILETLSLGKTKFLGLVPPEPNSNFVKHLDIRLIPLESKVPAYFYYTSGGKFNQMIRQVAKSRGYKLSEWDLTDSNGNVIPVKNEEEIFKILKISFIPMADRRKII